MEKARIMKKVKTIRTNRRLMAGLLTLACVAGSIQGSGVIARAEDDGDYYEEVSDDEMEARDALPDIQNINELASKWNDMFAKGSDAVVCDGIDTINGEQYLKLRNTSKAENAQFVYIYFENPMPPDTVDELYQRCKVYAREDSAEENVSESWWLSLYNCYFVYKKINIELSDYQGITLLRTYDAAKDTGVWKYKEGDYVIRRNVSGFFNERFKFHVNADGPVPSSCEPVVYKMHTP